jgi:Family of unknown function (DUF6510)
MSDISNVGDAGDTSLQFDGNAAAGMLAEVFGLEMTGAQSTCAHCGRTGPLGGMLLYGGVMGTVLRCPTCEQVQVRIVRVPGRDGQAGEYQIDLRGMRRLVITATIPA